MWLRWIVWPKQGSQQAREKHLPRGCFQVDAVLPPPAEPGKMPGLAKLGIRTSNNAIWGQPLRTSTQKPFAMSSRCRLKHWRSTVFPDGGRERLWGLNPWRCYTKTSFPRPTAVYLKAREQTNGLCSMNEFLNGRKHKGIMTQCGVGMSLVGWLAYRYLRAHAEIRDLVLKKVFYFYYANPIKAQPSGRI